jgi:hypothetical protein
MGVFVSTLVASPTTLKTGVNNVSVTYSGFVTATGDNNVAISAVCGDPNVRVISVAPSSSAFPLVNGPLQLNLQLTVSNSGGGVLQATVTVTFKTATNSTITRNLVFLY